MINVKSLLSIEYLKSLNSLIPKSAIQNLRVSVSPHLRVVPLCPMPYALCLASLAGLAGLAG